MDLSTIGRLINERRRAKKLTLPALAAAAGVARSTLAALESGKLAELGFKRVLRICAAVDLAIDVQPLTLDAPLMDHRHLTDAAGRELTKAAIDDIISRGDVTASRGLVRAIRADGTGHIAQRVREVVTALRAHDPKAHAFALMLPKLNPKPSDKKNRRG